MLRFAVLQRRLLAATLAGACLAPSLVFAQSAPNGAPVAAVDRVKLQAHLEFIASDLLEGRDTGSRGLQLAASYIVSHLKQWGVQPGGVDGTYFHPLPMHSSRIMPDGTKVSVNGKALVYGEDFIAEAQAGELSGDLVFVGHGYRIPNGENPYAGLDLKGKTIVAIAGTAPAGLRGRPGTDYETPALVARAEGAAGVIMLDRRAGSPNWTQRRNRSEASQMRPGRPQPGVPSLSLGPAGAAALLSGSGLDADALMGATVAPELMKTKAFRAELAATVQVETLHTVSHNVCGLIPGTDPTLKAETVILGAHYDHVGMREVPPGQDGIFNGADDDGSGTVALLNMAEAIAKNPVKPKRSILFLWFTGEERGLLGSREFVANPTVDLSKAAAMFNIDMIGRSKETSSPIPANENLVSKGQVYLIGPKVFSPALDSLMNRVNNAYQKLNLDQRYDDPNDPNRFWARSDHYPFAEVGIPAAFFFSGVHEDYHQLSDHVEKIDFEQLETISRAVLAMLWEAANTPVSPRAAGVTNPNARG